MGKAKCPLLKSGFGIPVLTDLPEFCWEECEQAWDKAVRTSKFAGEYDTYEKEPAEDDCQHYGLEFSHDALVAINEKLRHYVVVDKCNDCEMEYGEQAYQFECQEAKSDY